MPRLRPLVVLLVTAASCAHQPKVERQPSAHSWSGAAAGPQTRVTVDDKSAELFKPYELEGTFVLADVAGRQLIVVGSALAAEQMIPAATFEVPAALIGLSTGAIDERTSLVYTGKYYPRETWMHDQTLASALLNSVDWYFEELLRRIGPERLQHGLDVLAYGNRLLSDGPESFWTTSGLRVSALEQVAFWRRMESGGLPSPITPAQVALVERLLPAKDEQAGWSLHAKTGLDYQHDAGVGWLVGYVERRAKPKSDANPSPAMSPEAERWVFATLLVGARADTERMIPLRLALTELLLARTLPAVAP